jgi:hypothetical protein
MPDRSKAMTWTKKDILVLQVGGWCEAKNLTSVKKKNLIVDQANNRCRLDHSGETARKSYKDYDFYIPAWNVLSL